MRTALEIQGSEVVFLVLDLEKELVDAVQALDFRPMGDDFGQVYPGNHPELDRIYRNFEQHAHELVLQQARLRPIPWEKALLAFCEAVEGEDIDWWLTGSAALAVRGRDMVPGDLDLAVAAESAPKLEALLIDDIIEPPRAGFISDTFTRAFRHACIEWIAGIDDRADQHLVGDVGLTAASRLETIVWHGYSIWVPPLDLQLVVNEARGLTDRVDWIKREIGLHSQ